MPKRACYTLSWSSSNHAYELYEGQEDDALDLIPDGLAWSVWVSQLSSFAFHGQNGSYTARKERRQRGGEYWYAYARVEGNLTKRYLGRDLDLTLTRMEQVAQAFRLDPQAALHQKAGSASSRPRSAFSVPPGEKVFLTYLSEADACALMSTNHWQAASACLRTLDRGIGDGSDTQEGRGLSTVLGLLERLLAEAEASMRMHSVLEILLLLALALEVQGDRTGALAALDRALALAEPEGYLRLFLDEGPPMLALLHQALRHGLAPGYVAKLLAAASKTRSADSHRQASQPSSLMEPLTARERDVLRLILDGASNREIARQLTLSVNTAKKHVLNICGKLNVHSRAQAIVKARMLHLL